MQDGANISLIYLTVIFSGIVAFSAVVQFVITNRIKQYTGQQTQLSELMAALNAYATFHRQLIDWMDKRDRKFNDMLKKAKNVSEKIQELASHPSTQDFSEMRMRLQEELKFIIQGIRSDQQLAEAGKILKAIVNNIRITEGEIERITSEMELSASHRPLLKDLHDFHARLKWLITGR